jgi:large subunit ribosomal protein L4
MPTVAVYNTAGQKIGDMQLNDAVFGVEVNKHVLHEAVVMQLASLRRGTASTKTISEVSGGGIKPWRQKGTGRARQGSIRAAQWVGGGKVFGPHPRSYSYKLPKKVRRLAMKSALSSKVANGELIVVDDFAFDAPKTKQMASILKNLNAAEKALVVTADFDIPVVKSARNIDGVKALTTNGLNVYDILAYDKLVISRDAVAKVEEALS